jgi:23S rRNA (cytosine1962-C5)-methyltransferase
MNPCKITLKKTEEQRLLEGHTWVYSNEIDSIKGHIKSGEIAHVYDAAGQFIGKGFLNTSSKIFVRLLTRLDEEIDEVFFEKKITLLKIQKESLGYHNSYRVCFGEADGIPGFIVDKFGDYLSVQILSLGIDLRKQMLFDILVKIFKPLGIYERSDVSVREKEGLPLYKRLIYGEVPDEVHIFENHLKMTVNIKDGQKTGFFLDQQDNHYGIKPYVKDKKVLDCFSHVGGFGLHAGSFGAKEVLCIDSSYKAVETIKKHAELNKLHQVKALEADVFDFLRQEVKDQQRYDVIILDPPAFAKKQEHVKKAYQAYKEINTQAMLTLNDGGYLYTCSCSHFMTLPLFMDMVKEASFDAKKQSQLVEVHMQSKDHASLLGSDESLYLKCMMVRVNSLK